MNMSSLEILLTFNEPIHPGSVDVTLINIQGARGVTNTSLHYQLTSTSSFRVDQNIVRILISDTDFDALLLRPGVATMLSNTYLSMDSRAFTDLLGDSARLISNADAQRALIFVVDTSSPEVHAFSLDLESNTMTLTFSEPVDITSFAPEYLSISSHLDFTSGGTLYNLTGGRIHPIMLAASRVVTFTLSDADVTFFEVNTDIATGIGDTYLSALPGLVQDTNGNPNLLVSASSPVPVSNFTGDISHPRVLAFDLDMNVGALAVTFDDPVNVSTFNVSAITLQGSPSAHQPRDWYTLSEGYLSSSSHGFVVTVFLGDVDLNQVKLISSLCTEVHNCYMSVTSSIVLDPNEVDADPIADDSAIQVRQFIADTTHPEVLDWALDMNNGVIILSFSEVVVSTTFQPGQLTLQNMYSLETDTVSFTPSQSVLYFSFAHFLTSFLGVDDINTIKALTNIGTNVNNSLLSITANMIRDTNSNNVVAIPSSMALQALFFIPDTTFPTLVSFSLNINIGILSPVSYTHLTLPTIYSV